MTFRFPLFTVGMFACTPGSIHWSTGTDDLRSAFFDLTDRGSLALVLSNGHFECSRTPSEDPSEIVTQLADLGTAACRENARHVTAQLFTDRDSWSGTFPGAAVGGEGRTRWSEGRYTGIEEAIASGNSDSAILYEPTEVVVTDFSEQADVEITSFTEKRVRGTLRIDPVGVRARFEATRCAAEASLFDNIAEALSAFCDL